MEDTQKAMTPVEWKIGQNLIHSTHRGKHRYAIDGEIVVMASASIQAEVDGRIPMCAVKLLRPDNHYQNRSLYAVLVDGEWIPIVWCNATSSSVTILPPESLAPYQSVLRIPGMASSVAAAEDGELATAKKLLKRIYEDSAVHVGSSKLNSTRKEIRRFLGIEKSSRAESI